MKCTDVVPLFSARFDGELSVDELKSFEKHCASCASCANEWLDFSRSTRALRELGVPAVTEDYVDSLVAAALRAHTSGAAALGPIVALDSHRRRKLFVSHVAAVLLGAAAVFFLFWMNGSAWMRGQSQEEKPTRDEGSLASTVPEVKAVEPEVEVVERIVERIRYLPHPTQISEEARLMTLARLTTATTYFADAFRELSDKLEARAALGTSIAQVPEPMEAAPVESLPIATDQRAPERPHASSPAALALLNSARLSQAQATISIQRDGELLSLETSGTLDEIVPALIARIDDEDPAVSALVQQRLRDIWSDRTGNDPGDAPFGQSNDASLTQDIGWRRFFARDSDHEPASDPAAEWSSWWSGQSAWLAQAGV